ncbi:hypothetical protein PR048_013241 [Dryococelus australis]|uniref:Reverse transcriptase n=1 Tax=Dryococelus australis TaxID=614101 RepID=A0ABQ9HRK4_9NEOP|nr:hypothetical protein PR048_013241 [Dryococelus australis]
MKTYTPVIHGENGMKYEAPEKAETIADSLEKHFEPQHQLINEDLLKETRNTIKQKPQKKNKLKPSKIKTTEVTKIFKKLPNNKVPGPDSIPNEALKRLPPQEIEQITSLFNKMLITGKMPTRWKTAKIITLPKTKEKCYLPTK